jgi:hypothetical protein
VKNPYGPTWALAAPRISLRAWSHELNATRRKAGTGLFPFVVVLSSPVQALSPRRPRQSTAPIAPVRRCLILGVMRLGRRIEPIRSQLSPG